MSLPILHLKNAYLTFGGDPVFSGLDLQVMPHAKICLIGRNGCGKSTLMKVMSGIMELDKGEFFKQPGITVGYLPQTVEFDDAQTIFEYVIQGLKSDERDKNIYLADTILSHLSLSPDKMMNKLSGGKLRRASLARTLISKPDLLLLDEPTNHLDITSIEWLEGYLRNYRGSYICISHDREFLKATSNSMFWMDRGKLRMNHNNFSQFEEWSNSVIEQETADLQKLGKKLEEENLWLAHGVTARRKRNQRRLKDLFTLRSKLKSDKSHLNKSASNVKLPPLSEGSASKLVLELENISHSFTDIQPPKTTIKNFSMRIMRGEKIGIMGRNGAGKTTLLRLITGDLIAAEGTIKLGANLDISYSDQKRSSLDPNLTLWQTLCPNGGDHLMVGGVNKHVVSYLKDFMFDSAQAKSPVHTLSGGEANRLLLAQILARPGNLMILDEPTNDLDMESLDMLEEILSEYTGTLIIVSHDRDFLERIVTRTIIFEENHKIIDYIGGYSDYKQEVKHDIALEPKKNKAIAVSAKPASKLSYKFQRELELLPDQISQLTQEIAGLEEKLAQPNFYTQDPKSFNQCSSDLVTKKEQLDAAEMRWLELLELKENS